MRVFLGIPVFLLFTFNLCFGQIAIRVFNYRPTGELSFVMKPLTTIELGYQGNFGDDSSERFRANCTLMYLKLKPRLEAFPVYGSRYQSGVVTVLPGKQSFEEYSIIQLAAGIDCAVVHKRKFNFYGGVDLVTGATGVTYTTIITGGIEDYYEGGGVFGGIRGRLGAEYAFTGHIAVFANANRTGFLVTEPRAKLGANDYGLGLRYSFK